MNATSPSTRRTSGTTARPTQKHAEAGFQKAVDALTAEVTRQHWLMDARLACHSNYNTEILRDVPVDKVSSTDVPAEFVKCAGLDAAREAFERAFTYEATTRCRDFNESTRGSFNDTQLAESLLTASDMATMQRVEQQRDEKFAPVRPQLAFDSQSGRHLPGSVRRRRRVAAGSAGRGQRHRRPEDAASGTESVPVCGASSEGEPEVRA